MRIFIAMMLAAGVAAAPVAALAQDNNAAMAADAANIVAPAPVDANMAAAGANAVSDMAPPTDTAMANDAAAMPAPAPTSRPFPWGVVGLVGLIGLLGRRRG